MFVLLWMTTNTTYIANIKMSVIFMTQRILNHLEKDHSTNHHSGLVPEVNRCIILSDRKGLKMYCFITFSKIYRPDFNYNDGMMLATAEGDIEVGTIIDDEWIIERPPSFDGEDILTFVPNGYYHRRVNLNAIGIFESDIIYNKAYLREVGKKTQIVNGTTIELNVYENTNFH
jgi:hypothetical protein